MTHYLVLNLLVQPSVVILDVLNQPLLIQHANSLNGFVYLYKRPGENHDSVNKYLDSVLAQFLPQPKGLAQGLVDEMFLKGFPLSSTCLRSNRYIVPRWLFVSPQTGP